MDPPPSGERCSSDEPGGPESSPCKGHLLQRTLAVHRGRPKPVSLHNDVRAGRFPFSHCAVAAIYCNRPPLLAGVIRWQPALSPLKGRRRRRDACIHPPIRAGLKAGPVTQQREHACNVATRFIFLQLFFVTFVPLWLGFSSVPLADGSQSQ